MIPKGLRQLRFLPIKFDREVHDNSKLVPGVALLLGRRNCIQQTFHWFKNGIGFWKVGDYEANLFEGWHAGIEYTAEGTAFDDVAPRVLIAILGQDFWVGTGAALSVQVSDLDETYSS